MSPHVYFNKPRLLSQGMRQGIEWRTYIIDIRIDNNLRRANLVRYTRNVETKEADREYYHMYANCNESTLDGELVTARPRIMAEIGAAEILNTICNARK